MDGRNGVGFALNSSSRRAAFSRTEVPIKRPLEEARRRGDEDGLDGCDAPLEAGSRSRAVSA